MRLSVENFAQIEQARIDFGDPGDLTLIVGQQATGKSLVLQWLKLMADRARIRHDWDRYGTNWRVAGQPLRELDVFFGEGLGIGFDPAHTNVSLDRSQFTLSPRSREVGTPSETVYFIPAQRALLMADGWPKPFSSFPAGTPYVARAQSERLVQWLSDQKETIFPIPRRFPGDLRSRLNSTIFHGASVAADRTSPQSRLLLKPGGSGSRAQIPYMAWTAGQREFVPLLMALYRLLPSSAIRKDPEIDTVVIEEPELGLHPKAVFAISHAVMRLMERGYRVVISTHSSLMLDFAWALRRLNEATDPTHPHLKPWRDALEVSTPLAQSLATRTVRTYYMGYSNESGRSSAKDISNLRTNSTEPVEAAWGLMQEDGMRMTDVVADLMARMDARHGSR